MVLHAMPHATGSPKWREREFLLPSPTVISFVNYKGGVGKTTLAVETAVAVAAWDNVRVLLCDLDPQTNATFYLFNPDDWKKWAEDGETLLSLFDAEVSDRPLPDLGKLIHPWSYSSTSRATVSIDVLPSHIELMPMDLRLAVRYGAEGSDAVSILRTALATLGDRYEVVICDCPPNMGLVTQNALVASDKYVVVAMPEYLSTLGIETLCGAVETLSRRVSTAAAKSRFGWF